MKKLVLFLGTILLSFHVSAATVDCFERQWIVSATDKAGISVLDLAEMLSSQALLAVGEVRSDWLTVNYSQKRSPVEDKVALSDILTRIENMGFAVECNLVNTPISTMTGHN